MPTMRRYDSGGMGFEVAANPLSRVGVFPYTKRSIGFPGWEADPTGVVSVYRPESELNNAEAIASARLQPWIDDHLMLGDPAVEPGLTPPEKKGIHGTIGEQVFFDPTDGTLRANLRLWSPSLNDAIEAGKKELSMGYRCVYEFQSGEYEGQHYDAIQRQIRFNHLALVDEGRMGPSVSVLDHAKYAFDANDLKEVSPMAKITKRIATAKKLGVAVDALPKYFGMDTADAAMLAAWNKTMDAEEDTEDAPAASDPAAALEAAAEVVQSFADPLAQLQESLAGLAAPAADPVADPSDMPSDDDMEPMTDAAGNAVMDPATGKQKMKKKAAPAAPSADGSAIAGEPASIGAADSAIRVMEVASRNMHTALKGTAAPATLTAFDAAIGKAKGSLKAIRERKKRRSSSALDAAIIKIAAMDKKVIPAMDAAPLTAKDFMASIAARDTLYKKVSPHIGAFDHATMTVGEVAKYACDKLDLKVPAGAEESALAGYLANRPVEAPRTAASFSMDSAVKSSSSASDFISGKPKAA